MRIGITCDLRDEHIAAGLPPELAAEFDRADTIDHLQHAIERLGHDVDRVGGAARLIARLASGDGWDLVFNIAEGLHGFGRESLVPALLDHAQIPCTFSDPLTCALSLHKGMAKRVLRDCGVPTPEFEVIERPGDAHRVSLPFPLFAKPVAEGSSMGVGPDSRVDAPADLERLCERLIGRFRQPVLVERYLPGRECTAGVLGTGPRARTVAVMEVLLRPGAQPGAYTYANKEECESLVDYRLACGPWAERAADLALRAHRALACRDASRVDLRADDAGSLHVIEVNPLPGLHPEHSDLPIMCALAGIPYADLIARILASAMERVRPATLARAGPGPA
jgi:D-alanine-D-alanine ligase